MVRFNADGGRGKLEAKIYKPKLLEYASLVAIDSSMHAHRCYCAGAVAE